jgi:hypothetical protein
MKAVDELEAQRDQQRYPEQNKYADRKWRRSRLAEITHQAIECEQHARDQQAGKHNDAGERWPRIELRPMIAALPMVIGASGACAGIQGDV